MNRHNLILHIFKSKIFSDWHWFQWHFSHLLRGQKQAFADSVIDACIACDKVIPGFAYQMIDNIASICGKEKFLPHYEQLIQRLAEIHILYQILTYNWSTRPTFEWEPAAGKSKKNPEITINLQTNVVGIEVKAPALLKHYQEMRGNKTQFLSRAMPLEGIKSLQQADALNNVILPRDNPVKDFLISANNKFQSFKEVIPNFVGVLVIVWDSAIHEPLSALLTKGSGLLTDSSFAIDKQGQRLSYPYLDCVIVVPHLHQLMLATKDEPFWDNCRHTFDYGNRDLIPYKIFIPLSDNIPEELLDCLQVYLPNQMMGAEYTPSDFIWWISRKKDN